VRLAIPLTFMATLRLFASAREAAGRGSDVIDAATVGELLDEACGRYGNAFAAVLATCRVWCNGDETERDAPIGTSDEVAVLPPVSGGF
jgi:molybdopterin converting factor small subunit